MFGISDSSPITTERVAEWLPEKDKQRIVAFFSGPAQIEITKRIAVYEEAETTTRQSSNRRRKCWWKQPDDMLWDDWYRPKYLKSKGWKDIKRKVFERDSSLCHRCGGKATAVHHRRYEEEVMQGLDLSALVSICDGCHSVVHCDDFGRKRIQSEWEEVLDHKDDRTDFPPPIVDARKNMWGQELPDGWSRMNAVQRHGWRNECGRQWATRKVRNRYAQIIESNRRFLQIYGLNDSEIDLLISRASSKSVKTQH